MCLSSRFWPWRQWRSTVSPLLPSTTSKLKEWISSHPVLSPCWFFFFAGIIIYSIKTDLLCCCYDSHPTGSLFYFFCLCPSLVLNIRSDSCPTGTPHHNISDSALIADHTLTFLITDLCSVIFLSVISLYLLSWKTPSRPIRCPRCFTSWLRCVRRDSLTFSDLLMTCSTWTEPVEVHTHEHTHTHNTLRHWEKLLA